MKKYIIISSDTMTFKYRDGHENVSGGSMPAFVFSSRRRAMQQMDKIHELIVKHEWWSMEPGREDPHVLKDDRIISGGGELLRTILVTRDEDKDDSCAGYHLHVDCTYSLWCKEENSCYALD